MKFSIFGLFEQPEDRSARDVVSAALEQAELAEELGYTSFWMAEHHFTEYGIVASPPIIGAAMAERTTRLRLGTAVAVLPFHDPRRLAEDYAMLDVLSDGRLDFGVGHGYQPDEFAAFGIAMEDSRGRMAEAVDVIRGLWTEKSFSYSGQHFEIENLDLFPRPVQQPSPPIWMAAVSPESFALAGAAGHQILTAPQITSLDGIRHGYDTYREARLAAGHPVDDMVLPMQRQVYVSLDGAAARSEPAEHVMWYQRRNAQRMVSATSGTGRSYEFYKKAQVKLARADYQSILESGSLLFGTPDEVIAQIEQLRAAVDLNYLMCWMNFGGLPRDRVHASMKLFASEVMPAFE